MKVAESVKNRKGRNERNGRWTLRVLFVLAVVLLVCVGWLSYNSALQLAGASAWVAHTQEVLLRLEKIRSDIRSAEAGQRGYLLTDEPEYLTSYGRSAEKVKKNFSEVRRLLADNASQQRRLDNLGPLLDRRLALLREALDQSQQGEKAGALEIIRIGEGRQLTETIRSVIGEMEDQENYLLERRGRDQQASVRRTVAIVVAGGAVSVLLFIVVFLHLY